MQCWWTGKNPEKQKSDTTARRQALRAKNEQTGISGLFWEQKIQWWNDIFKYIKSHNKE